MFFILNKKQIRCGSGMIMGLSGLSYTRDRLFREIQLRLAVF
jgi:hypothetical protein